MIEAIAEKIKTVTCRDVDPRKSAIDALSASLCGELLSEYIKHGKDGIRQVWYDGVHVQVALEDSDDDLLFLRGGPYEGMGIVDNENLHRPAANVDESNVHHKTLHRPVADAEDNDRCHDTSVQIAVKEPDDNE